jgi:hypothetical protein
VLHGMESRGPCGTAWPLAVEPGAPLLPSWEVLKPWSHQNSQASSTSSQPQLSPETRTQLPRETSLH